MYNFTFLESGINFNYSLKIIFIKLLFYNNIDEYRYFNPCSYLIILKIKEKKIPIKIYPNGKKKEHSSIKIIL